MTHHRGESTKGRGRAGVSRARRSALSLSVALLCVVLPVALAGAEEGPATQSEVEAAATRAESAAAEARALLDRLRRGGPTEAAETEETVPATEAPAQSPEPLSVAEPGSPAEARPENAAEEPGAERLRRAIDEAEAASEEARAAAEEARAVAHQARAEMQAYRNRYGRKGPLLGVAGFYAVENFDSASGLEIDDSFGGTLFAGYRVHRHVSIEVRGEYLDGFDIGPQGDPSASMLDAEIDGFLITAGPKLYPFTGVLQPFVGLGLGAMRAELEGRASDGTRFSDDETDVVIRPAAGLDFYVSENLVLNLEAAYVSPGGSLQDIDFATFSSGLTFRF